MAVPRGERFRLFLDLLRQAPAAASFEEAYQQLSSILNHVEDSLTDIPYDPGRFETDGRLYPPLRDNIRTLAERPEVKRLRSRGHDTYIRENGAIEIVRCRDRAVELQKPGADGQAVWDEK